MNITLNHIGSKGGGPASIVEMTITGLAGEITEDISNMYSYVNIEIIENLREIADELEEHNKKLTECIDTNH